MSCRAAGKLVGEDSLQIADAKFQLAGLYAGLASTGLENKAPANTGGSPAEAAQPELRKRAEAMYSESLRIYSLKMGPTSERSRLAADGLAGMRQNMAQAGVTATANLAQQALPVPVARAPELSSPATQQAQATAAAAPALQSLPVVGSTGTFPAARKPGNGSAGGPSFKCGKARSAVEKMICADAELSQLDRELSRIYSRARNSVANRAAFRRQQQGEWKWREANCRDRACLLDWYAHRRQQLAGITERRNDMPTARNRTSSPQDEIGRFYRGN